MSKFGKKFMDIWKPVPGYENYYEVCTNGVVRSLDRPIPGPFKSTMIRKSKHLVPCKRNGYVAITLVDGFARRSQKLIHRLIAETFIPNPEAKPQVNHKNGNKIDNRVDNLEWVTCGENLSHAIRNGLKILPNNKGRFNSGSSRKIGQYTKDMRLVKKWDSLSEIYRQIKLPISNLSVACSTEKAYKGFFWRYLTNKGGSIELPNPRIDKELEKLWA